MRITNTRKSELKRSIKQIGLNESQFSFSGENEIYLIKSNDDYFDFDIKKESSDQYYAGYRTITSKSKIGFRGSWVKMKVIFEKWLNDIKVDIEHSPNPLKVEERTFSSLIKRMSSRFIKIYNQALIAEKNNLNEICGLGYRKAFEILLKDYLIKKNSTSEHEKIKIMPVSQCINSYVTSDEIKLLSHRVFWLGNDHAHYIKKWKGKSLKDLKKLIDLAINWIEIHEELLKVQKSMPKGKK